MGRAGGALGSWGAAEYVSTGLNLATAAEGNPTASAALNTDRRQAIDGADGMRSPEVHANAANSMARLCRIGASGDLVERLYEFFI